MHRKLIIGSRKYGWMTTEQQIRGRVTRGKTVDLATTEENSLASVYTSGGWHLVNLVSTSWSGKPARGHSLIAMGGRPATEPPPCETSGREYAAIISPR